MIERKLTTMADLSRFKDKWLGDKDLEVDQQTMLKEKVEAYEAQEAKLEKERAASFNDSNDSEK